MASAKARQEKRKTSEDIVVVESDEAAQVIWGDVPVSFIAGFCEKAFDGV